MQLNRRQVLVASAIGPIAVTSPAYANIALEKTPEQITAEKDKQLRQFISDVTSSTDRVPVEVLNAIGNYAIQLYNPEHLKYRVTSPAEKIEINGKTISCAIGTRTFKAKYNLPHYIENGISFWGWSRYDSDYNFEETAFVIAKEIVFEFDKHVKFKQKIAIDSGFNETYFVVLKPMYVVRTIDIDSFYPSVGFKTRSGLYHV